MLPPGLGHRECGGHHSFFDAHAMMRKSRIYVYHSGEVGNAVSVDYDIAELQNDRLNLICK